MNYSCYVLLLTSQDMHEALTQGVEEANKKINDLEARLKEVDANLKVKDAELAEAKVGKIGPRPMSHAK